MQYLNNECFMTDMAFHSRLLVCDHGYYNKNRLMLLAVTVPFPAL